MDLRAADALSSTGEKPNAVGASLMAEGGEIGTMMRSVFGALLLCLGAGGPALADPCKAIPDGGAAPAAFINGRTFQGRVVYVGDGDSLCVAIGPVLDQLQPKNWVEVRLDDFYGPELSDSGGQSAKATLRRISFGKRLLCNGEKQSYDRVVAHCTLEGRSVGDLMRQAGVREGGRGRRR